MSRQIIDVDPIDGRLKAELQGGSTLNIGLDGFALGLKKGTGLSTYSREITQTLIQHGHQVTIIYGVNGVGRRENLLLPRFMQSLAVHGEPETWAWGSWGPHLPIYLGSHLLRRPLRPRRISGADLNGAHPLPEGISELHGIYNLPSVYRAAQAVGGLMGSSLRMRRIAELDVFHRTSPLPVRMDDVANVVTAHDAIPLVLPESTEINLLHYHRIMRASLRNADGIFVVSRQSKHDLIRFFDIPEERLHVTYQSVNIPVALRLVESDVLALFLEKNFNLRSGQYFLFHGAIEPKKNLNRIIDGYLMARCEFPLVIAGKEGWLCDEEVKRLNRLTRDNQIRRIDYLPYWQLMYLLKGARSLVFPSLYEGFGLPVLEAMQIGTPVITSNNGVLREIAGDAAYLVDPRNTVAIAHAISVLAEDNELHASLTAKGLERAKFFSPQRHLERLEAGYRKVVA